MRWAYTLPSFTIISFLYKATKAIALDKLEKIEAFDGFIGEFSAETVSKQYEDLEGIQNTTYLANVVAGDKWWTKKYFSYMKDKPMNMANISDITFDTTEVNHLMDNYQRYNKNGLTCICVITIFII